MEILRGLKSKILIWKIIHKGVKLERVLPILKVLGLMILADLKEAEIGIPNLVLHFNYILSIFQYDFY